MPSCTFLLSNYSFHASGLGGERLFYCAILFVEEYNKYVYVVVDFVDPVHVYSFNIGFPRILVITKFITLRPSKMLVDLLSESSAKCKLEMNNAPGSLG